MVIKLLTQSYNIIENEDIKGTILDGFDSMIIHYNLDGQVKSIYISKIFDGNTEKYSRNLAEIKSKFRDNSSPDFNYDKYLEEEKKLISHKSISDRSEIELILTLINKK